MFLHIGNGCSVRKKDIIGIFDLDTATVSKITKDFISKKQKSGEIIYSDSDLPRAFILVDEKDGAVVRLSRISTFGLVQRAESRTAEE